MYKKDGYNDFNTFYFQVHLLLPGTVQRLVHLLRVRFKGNFGQHCSAQETAEEDSTQLLKKSTAPQAATATALSAATVCCCCSLKLASTLGPLVINLDAPPCKKILFLFCCYCSLIPVPLSGCLGYQGWLQRLPSD